TLFAAVQYSLDTAYYGKPTFTPLNFLRVNLSSVSSFYGTNQWHYYITQALPIICTTSLPFAIHGAWLAKMLPGEIGRASRTLFGLCRWVVAVYSLTSHKEWRFIHPVLPILHLFAALSLASLFAKGRTAEKDKEKADRYTLPVRWSHLILVLSTLPASLYVIFFHSRAQIAVMHHLRSLPASELRSVGFLMPCHSTPWQAYLHRPEVEMWVIGCEPPLRGQDISTYQHQERVFFNDPITYIQSRFPSRVNEDFPPSPLPSSPPGNSSVTEWAHNWPSHLAFFGHLTEAYPDVIQLLQSKGYRESWKTNNGWEEDERRRGGVQVWSYRNSS
ncbi:glycosylphosphatidylinositol anchor biosynthesis, partial [Tulasnella sp. 427]